MLDSKIDLSLLNYAIKSKELGFKIFVYLTTRENPLYKQNSLYSSYYRPRTSVYGSVSPKID